MQNRRSLTTGILSSFLLGRRAYADGGCPSSSFWLPFGQSTCNAFVNPKDVVVSSQENTEWCWAATISNIFAAGGYDVPQSDIVQAGIGQIANNPGNLPALARVLTVPWTDQNGKNFTPSSTILFSADLNYSAIDNSSIILSLQQNKPLLFCNTSHAMMLISVNYIPPPNSPRNIAQAVVVDPWPGVGLRPLSQAELIPMQLGGQCRLIVQVDV